MVDLITELWIPTLQPGKVLRVVFYWLKHYLTNMNTHVSNARMNIPKAIRFLKSNGFFLNIRYEYAIL